jgi:GTP-binding protein
MQIKSAEFITSASGLAECPAWDYPEFAFIGRSNVGKSSMINLLARRQALAKVSATPGKTRLLNFFLMNKSWALVDLPGYGFAKAAKSEKFDFNERAGDYLENRPNLRRVFTLIDSRHAPQRIDLDFLAWLGGTGVPFSLVFTKADKQSPAKTRASIALFLETLAPLVPALPEALTSSAKTGDGRNDILRVISREDA